MQKKLFYMILVVLIVAIAGFFAWKFIKKAKIADVDKITPVSSDSANINNGTSTISAVDKKLQEEMDANEEYLESKMPSLDRAIVFASTVTIDASTRKNIEGKIAGLEKSLKEDYKNTENWLVLGVYRKMIGDYASAAEVWKFVTILNPLSATAYNNLGDLYSYFLQDAKKAEASFLKAIEIAPTQKYLYRSTYEFYRFVAKDAEKAKAILQQGIKNIPSVEKEFGDLIKSL